MSIDVHDTAVSLKAIPPLVGLSELVPTDDVYIVGGALRDALLGRTVCDVDLVTASDPTDLAKQFAKRFSAHWFWLDQQRLQSRVLITESHLTFDFAPLRATTIEADLAARDFTINSLALPLRTFGSNQSIIDPLGGIKDLQAGCLRMSGRQAFVADPLRILKGIRHAVKLGFVLDQGTSDAIQKHAWRLEQVAVERVRQEAWRILADPAAARGLELFSITKTGRRFWGEGYDDHLDQMIASLKKYRTIWSELNSLDNIISRWLAENVEAGLNRETLLLWTLLLAVVNPGLPYDCAEKWQFSRRSLARIKAVAALDDTIILQFLSLPLKPRILALFAQKQGLDITDLFLAAAVRSGGPGARYANLIPSIKSARQGRAEDLVSGEWIAKNFHIPPGPEIGRALERLRDAELRGEVNDLDGAKKFLRDHVQNRD